MNDLMFWNIVRNLSLICHQKLDSAGKYNSNFQFVDEYVVLPVHFCYSLDSFMNTVGMPWNQSPQSFWARNTFQFIKMRVSSIPMNIEIECGQKRVMGEPFMYQTSSLSKSDWF